MNYYGIYCGLDESSEEEIKPKKRKYMAIYKYKIFKKLAEFNRTHFHDVDLEDFPTPDIETFDYLIKTRIGGDIGYTRLLTKKQHLQYLKLKIQMMERCIKNELLGEDHEQGTRQLKKMKKKLKEIKEKDGYGIRILSIPCEKPCPWYNCRHDCLVVEHEESS